MSNELLYRSIMNVQKTRDECTKDEGTSVQRMRYKCTRDERTSHPMSSI